MKFMRFLTASFFALSMVGCCCGRNVVMDPCDPCSGMMPSCGISRFWPFSRSHCGCGYSPCSACSTCGGGYDDMIIDGGYGGGCSTCGGGGGSPMPTSSCGCGGSHSSMMSSPPMPAGTYSAPMPPGSNYTPSGPTPAVPTPTDPPSVPGSEPTTMMPPVPHPQMMSPVSSAPMMSPVSNTPLTSAPPSTVSYEEFQRLPGTIISGPGAVTAQSNAPTTIQQTSGAQPFLAPPPPTSRTASRPATGAQNRQAVWVPAK